MTINDKGYERNPMKNSDETDEQIWEKPDELFRWSRWKDLSSEEFKEVRREKSS